MKSKVTGTLKFAHQKNQFSRASQQHPKRVHIKLIKSSKKPANKVINVTVTINGKKYQVPYRVADMEKTKKGYIVELHKRFKSDSNRNINRNLFKYVTGTTYLQSRRNIEHFAKSTGLKDWYLKHQKHVRRSRRVSWSDFIKYGKSKKKFTKDNAKYHKRLRSYYRKYRQFNNNLKQYQMGKHSKSAMNKWVKRHQPKHPRTPYGARPFSMMTFTVGNHDLRNRVRNLVKSRYSSFSSRQLSAKLQETYDSALINAKNGLNDYLHRHHATIIDYSTNTDETGEAKNNKYINRQTTGAPHLHLAIMYYSTKTKKHRHHGKVSKIEKQASYNQSHWLEVETGQKNHKIALKQFKDQVDPIIASSLVNQLQHDYQQVKEFNNLTFGRTGQGNHRNLSSTNYKKQQSKLAKRQVQSQKISHKNRAKSLHLSHTTRKLNNRRRQLSLINSEASSVATSANVSVAISRQQNFLIDSNSKSLESSAISYLSSTMAKADTVNDLTKNHLSYANSKASSISAEASHRLAKSIAQGGEIVSKAQYATNKSSAETMTSARNQAKSLLKSVSQSASQSVQAKSASVAQVINNKVNRANQQSSNIISKAKNEAHNIIGNAKSRANEIDNEITGAIDKLKNRTIPDLWGEIHQRTLKLMKKVNKDTYQIMKNNEARPEFARSQVFHYVAHSNRSAGNSVASLINHTEKSSSSQIGILSKIGNYFSSKVASKSASRASLSAKASLSVSASNSKSASQSASASLSYSKSLAVRSEASKYGFISAVGGNVYTSPADMSYSVNSLHNAASKANMTPDAYYSMANKSLSASQDVDLRKSKASASASIHANYLERGKSMAENSLTPDEQQEQQQNNEPQR